MKSEFPLFIYCTDTVWGVGSVAQDGEGHRRIAKLKKTDDDKPLSVLFLDFATLKGKISLEKMDSRFDEQFFQLESTLLVPQKFILDSNLLPLTKGSPYLGIRCLNLPSLSKSLEPYDYMVTSTSLNETGSQPAVTREEAFEIYQKWKKNDSHIVFIDEETGIIGARSSTIVKWDVNEVSFLREGRRVDEIKKLLGL